MRILLAAVVSLILVASMALFAAQQDAATSVPGLAEIQGMTARFAAAPIQVDLSGLSAGDRQALAKLIEASRILNRIFMEQFWGGDLALYHKLQQDESPLGRARLRYFWLNKGPWSEIDQYRAFLPGVPPHKLPGANFYPEDMAKEEFESWVQTLPADQKAQAVGFFTVIRRGADRKLKIVSYSEEHKTDLAGAAALLREAASLTDNASLKKFLTLRADAFASNDYFESDLAWMDLDAPVDVTFGPYETYNDGLFGYKAAFEAYINIRDEEESARLSFFGKHLQDIENNLPEDPKFRNPKLGALAPIRVVNEVFAAGDASHGVQTAAYNLPNDDRVIQQKGSKRVMLKNVQEEKFRMTLEPISRIVLPAAEQKYVSFESFFNHIVAHELMHGLGPHQITVGGRQTSVRLELKDAYAAIEEAKADVTGLYALQLLMTQADKGEIQAPLPHGPEAEKRLYTTYLASNFRTLRFGLQDAHARGMAMQFNYLVEHGGYVINPDGTFSVNLSKIKDAVKSLDHDLLTIEATGDYAGAQKLLGQGAVRPEVQKAIERMKSLPTDIAPEYVTANSIAGEKSSADGK
jgi:Peptidase family M49